MTGPDDDRTEMNEQPTPFDDRDLDDATVDALLSGAGSPGEPDLTDLIVQLRSIGDQPARQPSPELAALLGHGLPVLAAVRTRRRRIAAAVVAAAVGTIGLTGVVAANDALPSPAQEAVSKVVNNLTPFRLESKPRVKHTPSPALSSPLPTTPGVAAPTVPTATPSDDQGGSGSPGSGADNSGPGGDDTPTPGRTGRTEDNSGPGSGGDADGPGESQSANPSSGPSESEGPSEPSESEGSGGGETGGGSGGSSGPSEDHSGSSGEAG